MFWEDKAFGAMETKARWARVAWRTLFESGSQPKSRGRRERKRAVMPARRVAIASASLEVETRFITRPGVGTSVLWRWPWWSRALMIP